MQVAKLMQVIEKLGVNTIGGVPDSTLQEFCNYLQAPECSLIHVPTADEGAAVGLAVGNYLGSGQPACVYMQNSGMGNVVNPITSLTSKEVYHIPVLYIIGWRGEPGKHDEPQHKFMGEITTDLLELLNIDYSVLTKDTTDAQLEEYYLKAKTAFAQKDQYAIIVKKGAFEKEIGTGYSNQFKLCREDAIQTIIEEIEEDDLLVTTTGKISREAYEQSDIVKGRHNNLFLTVGGMGHSAMIAYGLAKQQPGRKIYCLDGDGALLMHTGSMLNIGSSPVENMVHICLNNESHESVGGMRTCAVKTDFAKIAEIAGYMKVFTVYTKEDLIKYLQIAKGLSELVFIEVKVALGARENLGRPKESAVENKEQFMKFIM